MDLLSLPGKNFTAADGTDTSHYGGLTGIADIRDIWSEIIGVKPENIVCATPPL